MLASSWITWGLTQQPAAFSRILASAWHRQYEFKKAYKMSLQDSLSDTASGKVQIIYAAECT